jgi:aminoglycoside phosphotransferase (APT) family kinase protein
VALLNTIEASEAAPALRSWFAGKLPGASRVEISDVDIPQSSGLSMTTILFRAAWREDGRRQISDLVARVAPRGPGTLKRPNLAKEFHLLGALRETDVPVPEPYWLEEDPAILGAPFMVMERVRGRVPSDDPPFTVEGWFVDLDPGDRGRLFENTLDVMRRIQAVDWRGLGLRDVLDEPEFGVTGIDQQLGHWEDSYKWATESSVRSPTIEAAIEWAKSNRPTNERLVLSWVDARPGNVIFGDDLSVRAVLDWEMAAIASPELDLGWMLFMLRFFTEGIGAPRLEGVPSRERLIEHYEQLTGTPADNADYYEAFAALVVSIVYLRVATLMIASGKLPPDSTMAISNPPSQILAQVLKLPGPAGAITNYVGKR